VTATVTATHGNFSMRCVECGLLLSEAEEAAGLLCAYCERNGKEQ